MAESTKIEWCDHTFNPWRGCEKVSPGCEHCYAEALSKRNPRTLGTWGAHGERVVGSDAYWKQPLKWDRAACRDGVRRLVFCASLADVFEERPELVYWRQELFALIDDTPHLDWLLLTKRPQNVLRMWVGVSGAADFIGGEVCTVSAYRPNVWLGTSVEDQQRADERIPLLLECRDLVPVQFLSCEPLLGPIDLSAYFGGPYVGVPGDVIHHNYNFGIDWVIVGGESGPHARPMHPEWARSIRDQCQAAGVAFFMKQMGGHRKPCQPIPEDLMIREFPLIGATP